MSAAATGTPRSTWNEWPRVQVHPGAGVVDRRGNTLLVVPVLRADQLEGAGALVALCRQGEAGNPVPLAAVEALLDRHPSGAVPGFVVLVRTGGAMRVLRAGPVRVVVDGHAPGQAGTDEGRRPAEHVLADDGWREMTVTADEGQFEAGTPLPGLADALPFDLTGGTVPGSGVTLLSVPAVRAAETPGADVPAAAGPVTTMRPAVRFRTVLLGECAARLPGAPPVRPPGRAPLPIAGTGSEGPADRTAARSGVLVEGVLCAAGHFTDPALPACPVCGSARQPDDRRVTRPRPPLGIVVTDGGTIYPVTGDVVIGREAGSAPEVLAGAAVPLLLRDEARSTSRVHAHLTVRGWTVLLIDNASANGTFVSRHGAAGPWLPVPPRTPLPLVHGDRLRLGQRQLLYDAWREAVVPEVFR